MDCGIRAETKIILICALTLFICEIVKSETSLFVESNVPSRSEHSILYFKCKLDIEPISELKIYRPVFWLETVNEVIIIIDDKQIRERGKSPL